MSQLNDLTIVSSAGLEPFIGPFGEILTAEKKDDVSVQFQYNYFDTQFDVVLPDLIGDGARTVVDSEVQVSSASNGTAIVSSIDSVNYKPGHSGFADFTLRAEGTGTVRGGLFDEDEQNGFPVDITNGVMTFGYLKSGVERGTNGAPGFDSVDTTGLDLESENIYRIMFGFLGVANPVLWVKKDTWRVLHVVKTEGVLKDVHVDTPVFPLTILARNGAIGHGGSWNGGTIGAGSSIGNRGFNFPKDLLQSGNPTTVPTQGTALTTGYDVVTIAAFRSKELFKGKKNEVKARLLSYNFVVFIPAGNVFSEVVFQVIGVKTFTGTPTWIDVDTLSSTLEYSHVDGIGSPLIPTSGKVVAEGVLSYTGSTKGGSVYNAAVDSEKIEADAYAGSIFCIVAKDLGGNGVTVQAIVNWEELF